MSLVRMSACFFLLLMSPILEAADWPAFRGRVEALQRGRAEGDGYPQEWSQDKNVAWRFPLPAGGNSSPVVSNGRVFVTCAEAEGTLRHLYCLEAATGKELWKKTVAYKQDEPTHKTNPHCGSSPAAQGDQIVVWHGSAGVYCYSREGKQLWHYETGPIHHIWGTGSSPIIDQDRVYLNIGPGTNSYMTALSLQTGETLWKKPEPGGNLGDKGPDGEKAKWVGSWSTPQMATIDGKRQVVCAMPTRLVSYDPESGDVLWSCDGLAKPTGTDLVYTDALLTADYAVCLAGFKGPGIGLRLQGSGDLTESARDWRVIRDNPQRIGSGVVIGEHVFTPAAGFNGFQCLSLKTGEVIWSERSESAFWGSMVLAEGLIYVTDQAGTTFVMKPDPEKLILLQQNELKERSNSTPAFVAGKIFLRTYEAVYCISE